uniref:lanC-like protein 2 isoform X2 n=1 Tax=Pristiophorus japonicus TaxID=55135 RepID=UPI00398E4BB3
MGEAMSKRFKSELEMEERSFCNPYPDDRGNGAAAAGAGAHDHHHQQQEEEEEAAEQQQAADCFDAQGKINPAFIKRIQSKIKDLLIQMEEGLKTADPHDCCAYTGWTGIALLYLQCFRVTQEKVHLQRSLDHVKRTLRNLNGRRVTFLCGDAGPLAVGAVVHHKLKNETESQECVTKLLQLHRAVVSLDSDISDELLYGRAGYLYALLYVNAEIGQETVPYSVIQEGKLSHNRWEQWCTGGGPSPTLPLTDLEERAAALISASRRSTTRAGAEPLFQTEDEEAPHPAMEASTSAHHVGMEESDESDAEDGEPPREKETDVAIPVGVGGPLQSPPPFAATTSLLRKKHFWAFAHPRSRVQVACSNTLPGLNCICHLSGV